MKAGKKGEILHKKKAGNADGQREEGNGLSGECLLYYHGEYSRFDEMAR